jgi:hypothetical protein
VGDPTSPLKNSKSKSKNEILIEDEESMSECVSSPYFQHVGDDKRRFGYIGVELEPVNQND